MKHILVSTQRRLVKSSMTKGELADLKSAFKEITEIAGPDFDPTPPAYTVQGEYPYSLRLVGEDLLKPFEELCERFENAGWHVGGHKNSPGVGYDSVVLSNHNRYCRITAAKTLGRSPEYRNRIIVTSIRLTALTEKAASSFPRNEREDEA